ncbi:hypothetical protein ACOZ4I_13775 [Haloarcula salina]|uniref:hypothetical protein n=1 Tax=Haloarcula salina TaxID=1429914 RepID=UPI003C6FAA8C
MVPPSTDSGDTKSASPSTRSVSELSERELYGLVRVAAEDAVLGAIGTLLLAGLGLTLFLGGLSGLLQISDPSPVAMAIAAVFVVGGAYLFASSLGVIPSVRDLL